MINKNAVISIAGTVGAGKSTLTAKLAEKLNFQTSYENTENNPYLDKYYQDFEKWGFHLQIFFLAERFKKQKEMFEYGGGFIQDRTIYEDLEIFAKLNYDNKTMSKDDYETYKNLFSAMVYSPYFRAPDLIIYIEGDFQKIVERIYGRGREMEMATDISYWDDLYQRYEKWINSFSATPVLRLNIDSYDVNDDESINEIVKKIDFMLQTHQEYKNGYTSK